MRPQPACPRALCAAVPERTAWRTLPEDPTSAAVGPVTDRILADPAGVGGALPGTGITLTGTATASPVVLLDLGRDVGGRIEVRIAHSTAPVRLAYAEAKRYLSTSGDSTGGSLGLDDNPDGRFDVVPAATAGTSFVSPGIRGGERWIRLSLDGPGTATIASVQVRYDGLALRSADYVGHFLSSDPTLNRTWYASVYTQSLGSIAAPGAPRVVVDGAKRDRLVWLGDLAVEGLTAFYTGPKATAVIRNSLAVFTCQQEASGFLPEASPIETTCPASDPTAPSAHVNPNPLVDAIPIGSYTPWWIVALERYYQYTGDSRFVARQLPAVPRALAWLASREHGGLYDATLSNELNWHPFDVAAGIDAHTNEVVYEALRDGATLERSVGHDGHLAATYTARAAALRSALLRTFWDSHTGALRGNTNDTTGDHPQDANVYGVVSGVLTGSQATRALAFVSHHLQTRFGPAMGQYSGDPYMSRYISPYISSWELWARFGQGQTAGALALDRRLFGYMARSDPGTMWEKVGLDGTPESYTPNALSSKLPGGSAPASAGSTSLAHGWSGGSASALPAFVLGVQPTAPGFARWRIAPQLGDLKWAQGTVPSPHGVITSRWVRTAHNLRLTVQAPAGTRGVVDLPLLRRPRALYRDGQLLWQRGFTSAHQIAALPPSRFVEPGGGRHTFTEISA